MAKTALEGTVYETSFSSSCNLKIYVHKATSEYQPKNIHRDMSRWGATHTPSPTKMSCRPSPKAASFSHTNCRATELSPTKPQSDLNP